MSARIARSVGSRARSAHSARVIDESGDHKNHSPDPDAAAAAAAVAAATAARGEAGSAALVCAEFAAEHTFRERAFPPGAPLPPPPPPLSPPPPPSCRYSATDPGRRPPFSKTRRRRRRNVSRLFARCIFRRGPRRIPAPRRVENARTTSSHAYRSADLPVDSVQFNAAVSRVHARLLSALLPPLLFLLSSLVYNRRKHLAPPVRNARASLTLGGPYMRLLRQIFSGYSSSRVPIAFDIASADASSELCSVARIAHGVP